MVTVNILSPPLHKPCKFSALVERCRILVVFTAQMGRSNLVGIVAGQCFSKPGYGKKGSNSVGTRCMYVAGGQLRWLRERSGLEVECRMYMLEVSTEEGQRRCEVKVRQASCPMESLLDRGVYSLFCVSVSSEEQGRMVQENGVKDVRRMCGLRRTCGGFELRWWSSRQRLLLEVFRLFLSRPAHLFCFRFWGSGAREERQGDTG